MKTSKKQNHIELLSKLSGVTLTQSRYAALCLNEKNLHRYNELYCNGEIDSDRYDKLLEAIKKSVFKKLPGLKKHIYFNGDPRGYALKLDDSYVREFNISITRDFGGYGILCPEFNRKNRG